MGCFLSEVKKMFHSECHAAFTLPEHVVATDDFRRRDYATDLEIRSDLETRCNLEYPGDLDVPHNRNGTPFNDRLS